MTPILTNLKNVTHKENGKNVKRNSKNTSGITGVYWNKREWTISRKTKVKLIR